jgi:hypothetical protein
VEASAPPQAGVSPGAGWSEGETARLLEAVHRTRGRPGAGVAEGLLPVSPSNLLYMENPYIYKKCQ